MKTRSALALCAAGLLVGLIAGFLAANVRLDAEFQRALAEKKRLMTELNAAADAIRESGSSLDSIRGKMAEATDAADKAAVDVSGKATTIEALVHRMKSYVQDARERLKELSEEMGKAVADNKTREDRIDAAIERDVRRR